MKNKFVKFLIEKGYNSFEKELSDAIKNFLEIDIDLLDDQADLSSYNIVKRSLRRDNFISCIKKSSNFIFIEIKSFKTTTLEIDIFSPDEKSLKETEEILVEEARKHFGLTKSKEALIKDTQPDSDIFISLREKLITTDSLSDSLFQRVKEKNDRDILRELKKKGSVLESDLTEFKLQGIETDRIKKTLDYFSGEEYQLVDRNFSIVCKTTNEMLFLVKDKSDIEGSKLLCPKCSSKIGDESVLSYYKSTEKLNQLLDGSRWMPLIIREALIEAKVPEENIYTEVKHGDDQIDVLVLYRGRIFVIEAKDRPVNLNDAYKLSAKTSHIASQFDEYYSSSKRGGVYSRSSAYFLGDSRRRRLGTLALIPIMISTSPISKEAIELLKGTNQNALFFENCEEGLNNFINEEVIGQVDMEEMSRRFNQLVSSDSEDSVSFNASILSFYAFAHWFEEKI